MHDQRVIGQKLGHGDTQNRAEVINRLLDGRDGVIPLFEDVGLLKAQDGLTFAFLGLTDYEAQDLQDDRGLDVLILAVIQLFLELLPTSLHVEVIGLVIGLG